MKHSFKQNNSLKSHKKLCRTILIGIVSFLVLTFLEVFLLSAVSLIPRSAIRKHTQESAEYLLEKPVFYRVVKQDPASNIDHYADAILLNILYHFDSAHPVTSPLTASYYYTETHNENENLYTAVTSNVTPTYDYFRYWHGSTIFIRPLLTILNIRQIYIFFAIIVAVLHSKGGFMAALDGLGHVSDPTVSSTPGVFGSFFGPDPVSLLSVVILTSLGTWGLPQMVQKFYAIDNEDSSKKGTIISTIFALVGSGGCYFLGGFGRLFSDKIDIAANGYDSIIPTMLENLHPLLIALVVILVLSASMSTLSSLVIASSSTLTIDLIKDNVVKDMSDKKQVLCIRVLIVIFIAISAIIAVIQYKSAVTFIAQLMGISWGALAGSFLAPFLYSLYWKKTTKAACWTSFVFGCMIMVLNLVAGSHFPALLQSPINCGAFAMLTGLIVVPVVSLFTKKPDAALIENTFACYDKTSTVTQKTALGK